MEMLNKRRVGTLALGLVMSFGLAACGGDAAPTATSVPQAAATNTTAAAVPTATTAAVPTATTALAPPTATTAMAPPTATTAMAAEPTATTASSTGGGTMAMGGAGEIQAAAKGMKSLKTYRIDVTSDISGTITTMGADVDAANNKLRLETGAAGQNVTMIVIGSEAWISMDGGKTYIKDPSGAATAQSLSPFIRMWDNSPMDSGTPAPEGAIKAASPATETIDGTQTNHWIVDSSMMGGGAAGASGTAEVWVTTGDNPTIRQMKTSAAGTTTTIKWSKINEDIKIDAPTTP